MLQPSATHTDLRHGAIQFQRQRDAAQKFLAQQGHRVLDHAADVRRADERVLRARVAEHRADDALALHHGLLDVGHVFLDVGAGLRLAPDELVRHADDGEQIVEIMRDAGGERAERLHFLAVHQLHLGDFQFTIPDAGPGFRREIAGDGFAMVAQTRQGKQRRQTKSREAHDQGGLHRQTAQRLHVDGVGRVGMRRAPVELQRGQFFLQHIKMPHLQFIRRARRHHDRAIQRHAQAVHALELRRDQVGIRFVRQRIAQLRELPRPRHGDFVAVAQKGQRTLGDAGFIAVETVEQLPAGHRPDRERGRPRRAEPPAVRAERHHRAAKRQRRDEPAGLRVPHHRMIFGADAKPRHRPAAVGADGKTARARGTAGRAHAVLAKMFRQKNRRRVHGEIQNHKPQIAQFHQRPAAIEAQGDGPRTFVVGRRDDLRCGRINLDAGFIRQQRPPLQRLTAANVERRFLRRDACGHEISAGEKSFARTVFQIPDADALALRGDAPAAARRKIHRQERALVLGADQQIAALAAREPPDAVALGRFPKTDAPAVARKNIRQPFRRDDERLALRHVPKARGAVARTRREQFAIRAERQPHARLAVAAQNSRAAAGLIPQINVAILRGTGQPRAVRRPRDRINARGRLEFLDRRLVRVTAQLHAVVRGDGHLHRARTKPERARADANCRTDFCFRRKIKNGNLPLRVGVAETEFAALRPEGHARDLNVRGFQTGGDYFFLRGQLPDHHGAAGKTRGEFAAIRTEDHAANRQPRARTERLRRKNLTVGGAVLDVAHKDIARRVAVGVMFQRAVHLHLFNTGGNGTQRLLNFNVGQGQARDRLGTQRGIFADGGGVADDVENFLAPSRLRREPHRAGLGDVGIPQPLRAGGLGLLGARKIAGGVHARDHRRDRQPQHHHQDDADGGVGAVQVPPHGLTRGFQSIGFITARRKIGVHGERVCAM